MAPLDPDDPDVLHLKLPNKVQFATVGPVLDRLEPLLKAPTEQVSELKLFLDMSSTAFVSPTGITILAAALERLWGDGKFKTGTIQAPNSPLLVNYLQRMNFFRELELHVEERFERREPKGFRPVTRVPDEAGVPAATREMVAAVEERHDLDPLNVGALKICVNELMENVFYHAQSPTDALCSVQAYVKKNRTELVIADTGRGIRPALTEVPQYRGRVSDDCSAIRLALEKNVTTTDDPKRGIGLWVASELVRRNEGEMLILSNEGGVAITESGSSDVESHFWPGTLIAIEFRMDMPIDVKAVYDSGGFPGPDDDLEDNLDGDSFDF